MSGYQTDLFVDPVAEYCICSICLEVLKDPRQCPNSECEKSFCLGCINRYLEKISECPSCKSSLKVDLLKIDAGTKDIVEQLKLRCTTTSSIAEGGEGEETCGWIGAVVDLEAHVSTDCGIVVVACTHEGCGEEMQRKSLENHISICPHKVNLCRHCESGFKVAEMEEHENSCPEKPIPCPRECGTSVSPSAIENHLSECPLEEAKCPNQGCDEVMIRKQLEEHDAGCQHKLVACPLCGEAVKRSEADEHVNSNCPERPTGCPNECGVTLPLSGIPGHTAECPLQEVTCPYATLGCSALCTRLLKRKDLEAHLSDPVTMASTIRSLVQRVAEDGSTIRTLKRKAEEDAEKMEKLENDQLLSLWVLQADPDSSRDLAFQMRKHKHVAGEIWTTHNIAWEPQSELFRDLSQPFDMYSPKKQLLDGVTGYIQMEYKKAGGGIACYARLEGFRGKAEITITVFRFGRGAPQQGTLRYTWEEDKGWGWASFLTQADYAHGGYVTPDNKIRILLSLCLKH